MAIADVLLFSKAALLYRNDLAEREPPLTKAYEVAPGIQLAAIKADVAHAIFHACKLRELEPNGDQCLYALVRYDPPGAKWDDDRMLSKILDLSHFVHANEGGFEFSARIQTDERSRLTHLEPAHIIPSYARAYCCTGVQRRWLTQQDAEELKALVVAYDAARDYLSDKRVGMAVSLFADSHFIFPGRPRVSLLAAALEGLVSVSPLRALKQFTVRIPALAAEVGLQHFDRDWAERMYKLRSKLAHGVPILQSPDEQERNLQANELNTAMTELDELLRRIVRNALLDRAFAEGIHNIAQHWPVPGNGCPTCRGRDGTLVEIQCPSCGSKWR